MMSTRFSLISVLLGATASSACASTVVVDIPDLSGSAAIVIDETAQVTIPVSPTPVGLLGFALESRHQSSTSVNFASNPTIGYSIQITAPDQAMVGETVELSGVLLGSTGAATTVNTNVSYGLSLGIDSPSEGYIPILDTSTVPGNPYSGSLNGTETDTALAAVRRRGAETSSTDTTGYNGVGPVVPPGTPTQGFVSSPSSRVDAWSFGPERLLARAGQVLPGLSFTDIELTADFDIVEEFGFATDLATAYYSFDGVPSGSFAFPINAEGIVPTIEIPGYLGLVAGDMFEITIDTITLNHSVQLDYLLDGGYTYQLQACLPLVGCDDFGPSNSRDFDNERVASWFGFSQQIIPVGQTISFEISEVPLPASLPLVMTGLAALAFLSRRRFVS